MTKLELREEYEEASQKLIDQYHECELTVDQFDREMEDIRVEYLNDLKGMR